MPYPARGVRKLKLSVEEVEAARSVLLARSADEDLMSNTVTLASNVTLPAYLKFRERGPHLSVKVHLVGGKVIAYEVSDVIHGQAQSEISGQLRAWNMQLRPSTELDIITGPAGCYKADVALRPINLPIPPPGLGANGVNGAYPTLVVEIGFTESLPDLHSHAPGYFSGATTIQAYLAIKVFSTRQNGTQAMAALLYLRASATPTIPVNIISFGMAPLYGTVIAWLNTLGTPITGIGSGGVPCNAPGIPAYQLHIATAVLFNGVPGGVPAGVPISYALDLWLIQNVCL